MLMQNHYYLQIKSIPPFLFYKPFQANFSHIPQLHQMLEDPSPPLIQGGGFHTMDYYDYIFVTATY